MSDQIKPELFLVSSTPNKNFDYEILNNEINRDSLNTRRFIVYNLDSKEYIHLYDEPILYKKV